MSIHEEQNDISYFYVAFLWTGTRWRTKLTGSPGFPEEASAAGFPSCVAIP